MALGPRSGVACTSGDVVLCGPPSAQTGGPAALLVLLAALAGIWYLRTPPTTYVHTCHRYTTDTDDDDDTGDDDDDVGMWSPEPLTPRRPTAPKVTTTGGSATSIAKAPAVSRGSQQRINNVVTQLLERRKTTVSSRPKPKAAAPRREHFVEKRKKKDPSDKGDVALATVVPLR